MTSDDTPRSEVGPATPRHAARPVDASMSLLNEVMYRPLDPEYAEAARSPAPPATGARRAAQVVLTLALATVLGLVTVSAVSSLRTPQPSAVQARALLEKEIDERSSAADRLQADIQGMSEEIAQLQTSALAEEDPGLFLLLQQAELHSGAVSVAGPGLVIELDDGEEDEDDPRGSLDHQVQDVDLQIVTNGLWAAGAEAIAVNGRRLTALSAIRSAGQAILVGPSPLIAPYRIEAIGEVRTMQTSFARSSAAAHLGFISGTYGIETSITATTSLELSGAGSTTLRHARALPDVASSDAPDKEGSS
ncbi:DUF881 domain-containing protein [Actinotalea sp. K2]|uniref:DUF881 domain-containing protein n=1 Tax=Actinotalea sp. K2 TaxID=2939438 RepID=UPI0020171217|nr:DUF881 domain-containing protein [Actinotalea sp. K2]MCL3862414.1 DUF881 domain-containing protein [Actinotalea sp. K2]